MDSRPPDDSNASTALHGQAAAAAPEEQDSLVYNFISNLSPLKSEMAARYRQRSFPGLPNPSPVFALPQMHMEPDEVLTRLKSTVGVQVEGDLSTDTNFLKEVNPVGFTDIMSTSFNSQQDNNLNPQYYRNSRKDMVLEDNPVKLSNEVQERLPIVSLDQIESASPDNLLDYASQNVNNFWGNDEKVLPYSGIQHHEQCAADLQVAQHGYGARRPLQFEAGFSSFEAGICANSLEGQVPNNFTSSANNSVNHIGTNVDLQDLSKGPVDLRSAGKDVQIGHVIPMRKRKKSVITNQEQDCRKCNCKRSKCLKLYCECFSAGIYCVDSCACDNCYNKPEYEEIVLATRQQIESRNPIAFAPKVVSNSENTISNVGVQENFVAASSGRHKRGCNCKRSKCLKRYCECFQSKVGCSFGCRCENCQNSFGIKTEAARSEKLEKPAHENPYTAEGITHSMNTGSTDKFLAQPVLADISNLTSFSHSCVGPTASSTSYISGDWRGYNRERTQVPATQPVIDASLGWMYSPVSLTTSQSQMGKNDENYPPHAPGETNKINVMVHISRDNHNPTKGILSGSNNWNATSSFGLRSCQKLMLPFFPSLTAPGKSEDKINKKINEDQNK